MNNIKERTIYLKMLKLNKPYVLNLYRICDTKAFIKQTLQFCDLIKQSEILIMFSETAFNQTEVHMN